MRYIYIYIYIFFEYHIKGHGLCPLLDTCSQSNVSSENFHWIQAGPHIKNRICVWYVTNIPILILHQNFQFIYSQKFTFKIFIRSCWFLAIINRQWSNHLDLLFPIKFHLKKKKKKSPNEITLPIYQNQHAPLLQK